VWDRSEVEGPSLTNSERGDKEREKRERQYEITQIQREKESTKVYQPSQSKDKSKQQLANYNQSNNSGGKNGVATFKTHMAQKNAQERERKISVGSMQVCVLAKKYFLTNIHYFDFLQASMMINDHHDELDMVIHDLPAPVMPVPSSPASKSSNTACLTYNRVPWKLRVRKEVFRPNENVNTPAALDLIFTQVACDVFGLTACLRISPQEKRAAQTLLNGHGVTAENMKSQVRAIVKRHLIDMARGWPLYFSRLFIVNGSPTVADGTMLAISHAGIYLAKKEQDYVTVQKAISFTDIHSAVTLPRPSALQLNMRNGNRLTLHAPKALAIQSMIQSFLMEFKQVSGLVFFSSFFN
jgi:myosin-15